MKLLSGILGLTLTSALALASANAADLYRGPVGGGLKDGPYVPVATWTGFYVGVNGGYGWQSDSEGGYPGYSSYDVPAYGGIKADGGFGGGQIGYNWQGWVHPNLVFGIEADFQGADIKASASPYGAITEQGSLDWFGTVRGRLGYATERTLFYFTGGFAYGGLKLGGTNVAGTTFNYDDTATGYVLGGGIEYKISPAWSLKAEYQYLDLGKREPVDASGKTPDLVSYTDEALHTVRVGLNYHFLPSYEPLK
ncbi:MAG: outer membrane protein [Rhodomicrobium sp.]